jgi:hypothetical protein
MSSRAYSAAVTRFMAAPRLRRWGAASQILLLGGAAAAGLSPVRRYGSGICSIER